MSGREVIHGNPDPDPEERIFGFCVTRSGGYLEVSLPHQCDEWEIAWGRRPEEVAIRLKEFIEEAQAALAVVEAQPDPGPVPPPPPMTAEELAQERADRELGF